MDKKQTNYTPIELVHQVKITEAMKLLLDERNNVGEIASMLGMEHSYFCRLFKKMTDFSPAEFRKSAERVCFLQKYESTWLEKFQKVKQNLY